MKTHWLKRNNRKSKEENICWNNDNISLKKKKQLQGFVHVVRRDKSSFVLQAFKLHEDQGIDDLSCRDQIKKGHQSSFDHSRKKLRHRCGQEFCKYPVMNFTAKIKFT